MSCHWFVERLKGRFYGKLLTFLRSDNRNLLVQCNSIHLGKVGCFTRKACWTENNPDKFSCMTGFKAKGTDCVGMLNIVLIVGMCSSAVLAQGMIIMHVQWSTTDALSSCLDPSMSCVGREVTWVSDWGAEDHLSMDRSEDIWTSLCVEIVSGILYQRR